MYIDHNKTYLPKVNEIVRKWYHIDATDRVLGRISTVIARILMGKRKVNYTPHFDTGDFVVVTNAARVKITGNKLIQKEKFHHTGHPGGARFVQLIRLLKAKPERVIFLAVKDMLPKNRKGKKIISRLKIYPDANHKHKAQALVPVEFK